MQYTPIQIAKGTFSSDITTLYTATSDSTGIMVKSVSIANLSTASAQLLVKVDGFPVLPNFSLSANDAVTNAFDGGWQFLPSGGIIQGQSTATSTNYAYLISGLKVTT